MCSGTPLRDPVLYLHDLPAAITAKHLKSALQIATIDFDEAARYAIIKFPSVLLAKRAMKAGVICSVSGTSDVNLSLSATPPERLDVMPQVATGPKQSGTDKSGLDVVYTRAESETQILSAFALARPQARRTMCVASESIFPPPLRPQTGRKRSQSIFDLATTPGERGKMERPASLRCALTVSPVYVFTHPQTSLLFISSTSFVFPPCDSYTTQSTWVPLTVWGGPVPWLHSLSVSRTRDDWILQVPNGDNERIAKQGPDPGLKENNECRPTDVDRDRGHAHVSSDKSQCADQFAENPPSVQAPPFVDTTTLQRLLKKEREKSDKRNSDHIRALEKRVIELQRQNDIAELELQSQRQQMSNLIRDLKGSTLATALQAACDENCGLEQKLVDLGLEVEAMKLYQTQLEDERSRLLDSCDELQSTKEQLQALYCELEDTEREITKANYIVRAASFKHAQEIFDLQRQLCVVNSRCKILELEGDKLLWEEARVKREQKEQKERETEQKRRAEEMSESMRKMEDEERQKERLRKKVEDEARLERERVQAEREEKQRLQRQKWHEATKAEKRRCQRRDKEKWNLESWTDSQAVERFLVLMVEFETMQYSESKPLTSSGIPWPVLTNPRRFKESDLDDWQAVDSFFKFSRRHQEAHAYKKMVMRARQMFHPDRWKSRSLLKTVMDESVRSSLEAAGNKVSQAVNAL
ncbi:hypothetical protein DFS33DRAFT_1400182 [Desarmillaria ectypa]|nr:hypothetical protein DFS33DRAFT_1400182 [Desarmillaria ectypa]